MRDGEAEIGNVSLKSNSQKKSCTSPENCSALTPPDDFGPALWNGCKEFLPIPLAQNPRI